MLSWGRLKKPLAGRFFTAHSAFSASRRTPLATREALGYSAPIETTFAGRTIMNIAKNMEAIFVAALAFAGSASFVADTLPAAQAHTQSTVARSVGTATHMAVVVVSGKRMSAAEKLESMQAARATPRSQG
jgi:hypothetical protein